MSQAWSSDLTYDYYRRILRTLVERYEPILLREVPERRQGGKPHAAVRHDIDVSPRRALNLAQIEHEEGLRSTFLFLVNTPLYSIEDAACRRIFADLFAMGHDIALHFEVEPKLRRSGCHPDAVEEQIQRDADRLAQASGAPVAAVSFHRPLPTFLRGPLRIGSIVNAYAEELMAWYLSDSNGSWREGAPLRQLETPRHDLLQMLVHPIWWGPEHLCAADRLTAFYHEEAEGRSPEECERLDRDLIEGIQLPDWHGAGAGAADRAGLEPA